MKDQGNPSKGLGTQEFKIFKHIGCRNASPEYRNSLGHNIDYVDSNKRIWYKGRHAITIET